MQLIEARWVGTCTEPVKIHLQDSAINRFISGLPVQGNKEHIPFTYPITFWQNCTIPWLHHFKGPLIHGQQVFSYERNLVRNESIFCQICLENMQTKTGTSGQLQFLNHVMKVTDESGSQILIAKTTLVIPLQVLPPVKSEPEKSDTILGQKIDLKATRNEILSDKLFTTKLLTTQDTTKNMPINPRSLYNGQKIVDIRFDTITKEMLYNYALASKDLNPIHLDEKAAQKIGAPKRIIQGMLIMGLAGVLLQEINLEMLQLSTLSMRFHVPLFEENCIRFVSEVESVHVDESSYSTQVMCKIQILRVHCEAQTECLQPNHAGEVCYTGTAIFS